MEELEETSNIHLSYIQANGHWKRKYSVLKMSISSLKVKWKSPGMENKKSKNILKKTCLFLNDMIQ